MTFDLTEHIYYFRRTMRALEVRVVYERERETDRQRLIVLY